MACRHSKKTTEAIIRLLMALFVSMCAYAGHSQTTHPDLKKKDILGRIFNYAKTADTTGLNGHVSYSYTKYVLSTDRRNFLLMAVPEMYHVARSGDRSYLGETYNQIKAVGGNKYELTRILNLTTFPHRRMVMENAFEYLTPRVYSTTILKENILSPFNRNNRIFYRYKVSDISEGTVFVTFTPKLDNTQLVSGTALVDMQSGRIMETDINGEYDMLRYHLNMKMGDEGFRSFYPEKCNLTVNFSLLGNKIRGRMATYYGLPNIMNDSFPQLHDTVALKRVRPIGLTPSEQAIYDRYSLAKQRKDTATTLKKRNKTKEVLWDMIGENMLTRIKSRFGRNGEGSFRISPIINPLYLGYSGRRGVTYKMTLAGNYQFTEHKAIDLRIKTGYSFKQRQLYFTIPLTFYWNKQHNGHVRIEVGNGNRISNNSVLEYLKESMGDSVYAYENKLIYFKDMNLKVTANYDFSQYFAVKGGMVFHRRSAVDKHTFDSLGQPSSYRSAAPMIEVKFRPMGYNGPVITADYERGIKGLSKANVEYERWEFDGQYVMPMSRLQTLSMRAGYGFYTKKGEGWRFLDYTNFRENNIPGGWNDDWSGEFELLDRNWYNMSEYYVRANMTYESPILFASWLPLAGRFIEMERIYVSSLVVRHLHPYTELGYGFTTRLFSMGMFASFKNQHYDGIGFKFGFELFRRW